MQPLAASHPIKRRARRALKQHSLHRDAERHRTLSARHALRRRARGVTLFEVLIVVAILALVAAGVGISALTEAEKAKRRLAESDAHEIRKAARLWWADHEVSACPSLEALLRDKILERDGARHDPWGGEYRIECADEEVTVTSSGRDRKLGTEDDVRVPRS